MLHPKKGGVCHSILISPKRVRTELILKKTNLFSKLREKPLPLLLKLRKNPENDIHFIPCHTCITVRKGDVRSRIHRDVIVTYRIGVKPVPRSPPLFRHRFIPENPIRCNDQILRHGDIHGYRISFIRDMIFVGPPYPGSRCLRRDSNPRFARRGLLPYKSTVPGWIRSHTRFPTIADTKLMVASRL